MSELEDRINSVLSDPEQMQKISRLARSLMGDGEGDGAPTMPDGDMVQRISRLMSSGSVSNRKERALLEAMKPYLSEKRRKKMDKALQIARLAGIARMAMGEMEASEGD